MLERLGRGSATITELAEPFGISLTGMKKHVRVLEDVQDWTQTYMEGGLNETYARLDELLAKLAASRPGRRDARGRTCAPVRRLRRHGPRRTGSTASAACTRSPSTAPSSSGTPRWSSGACSTAGGRCLQRTTGLTKGNLSSHLTKLEDAGLIAIEKQFVRKKPNTNVALTALGKQRTARHREQLERLRSFSAQASASRGA